MSTPNNPVPPPGDPGDILTELRDFRAQCETRYTFNNRWDVFLTVGGIAVGVAVVAAGANEANKVSTILGAVVTAILSAQRAFPFGQRAQFYRSLVGQTANLQTDVANNLTTPAVAATALKSLRLDFAQQLPRGGTSGSEALNPSLNHHD
jgi:hypothetical protein